MDIDQQRIDEFQQHGATVVRGLFADWVDVIAAGIKKNMVEPGPFASENIKDGESGRFFDDYCNWQRIVEFRQVIFESQVGRVAAALMQSESAQLFHDHVLVKEPGTAKSTPWHQDAPYYFVDGFQNVSFWCPIDPVDRATLRCVAGSHRWKKLVLPTRWLSNADFYPDADEFMVVPNPDAENMTIKEWPLEPGDAVAFHYRTLHGARGNDRPIRRRVFSVRFVGDDSCYITRPGPTSPPFAGHDMVDGERLREDWFPIVYRASPG